MDITKQSWIYSLADPGKNLRVLVNTACRQLIHQSGLCKTDLLALSVLNSPLKGL